MRDFEAQCTGQGSNKKESTIVFVINNSDNSDKTVTTVTINSSNINYVDGFIPGQLFDITITPKKK